MGVLYTTDRIALRTIEPQDAQLLTEYCQDEAIQRFTTVPVPYRQVDAENFVVHSAKRLAEHKGFDLAITLLNDSHIRGMIGLAEKGSGRAELGYWIAAPHRGERLVREAVGLAVRHAFEARKLRRIEAHVYTPNEASAKVLEHHGFVREGTMRKYTERLGTVYDAHLYALTDDDYWERNRQH